MANYKLTQSGQEVQDAINKIIALGPASQSVAGTMSAEDKTKLDNLILSGSTEFWNSAYKFVPFEGQIIIYTDYKTDVVRGELVDIPGIKIGSGNGYVQDLVFIDQADSNLLLSHINNEERHITSAERDGWNRKLNVNDLREVVGETLIFNRD